MSNKNVNVRKSQEITFCLLAGILMFMAMMVAGRAEAGVALGATRVIYPAGQKQVQLAVTNNDENSTYLIQSDNMQLREIFTAQLRQLMQHIGIQQRQTVENTARQFSITFRDRLRRFPTRSLNFAAHRFRINKAIAYSVR